MEESENSIQSIEDDTAKGDEEKEAKCDDAHDECVEENSQNTSMLRIHLSKLFDDTAKGDEEQEAKCDDVHDECVEENSQNTDDILEKIGEKTDEILGPEEIEEMSIKSSSMSNDREEIQNTSISNVENENVLDAFTRLLEITFPRRVCDHADLDIISREESDRRITGFLLTTLALFVIAVTTQIVQIAVELKPKDIIVVQPKLVATKSPFARAFPHYHMAMILENGSVVDFSLNEGISPSKGTLVNLPQSQMYHGYADEKGVLYFIDGQFRKPIVRYHKSFSNEGHQILPSNHKKYEIVYNLKLPWFPMTLQAPSTLYKSARIGTKFLLYGAVFVNKNAFNYDEEDFGMWATESVIWFTRRNFFAKGISFPFLMQEIGNPFCIINVNRSHAFIAGYGVENANTLTAILNLEDGKGVSAGPLVFAQNEEFSNCNGALQFDKDGKREVIVHLQTKQLNSLKSRIIAYDLELGAKGQWNAWSELIECPEKVLYIWDLNGRLYSILHNGTLFRHAPNQTWTRIDTKMEEISSEPKQSVVLYQI